MYQLVIFDVDGTLIDTAPAVALCYQQLFFEEFGRHLTSEEFFQDYTLPTNKRLENLAFKDVEEAANRLHTYLMRAYCNVQPFNDILNVLDFLSNRNITMGIVTARSKNEVENDPCLKSFISRFKHVICADDTIKHKPDADPILELMKRAGAEKNETIYIGDTFSDYMCAKNAGVHFGLALWGAKFSDGIKADYNFTDPHEIIRYLFQFKGH